MIIRNYYITIIMYINSIGCMGNKKASQTHILLDKGFNQYVNYDNKYKKWPHENVFVSFENGFNNTKVKVFALNDAFEDTCILNEVITTDASYSLAKYATFNRCKWYVVTIDEVYFFVFIPNNISAAYINLKNKDIFVSLTNKIPYYR